MNARTPSVRAKSVRAGNRRAGKDRAENRRAENRRAGIGDDAGYATLVSAAIIAIVCSLALGIAGAGGLVVARHRAQVAADLAAVAGAFALYRGEDGCAVAGETAELNSARLVACETEGGDVIATAQVKTRQATARAGPL